MLELAVRSPHLHNLNHIKIKLKCLQCMPDLNETRSDLIVVVLVWLGFDNVNPTLD